MKKMAVSLGTRIFLSSLCVTVFTVGSFLNISLVFILIRSRENRAKISSVYLLCLSTSQILACLYEAPYYFISLSLKLPPPPQEQYRIACRISLFITYFIAAVKIFSLMFMSVDRYIAITFPFVYQRHATKHTATLAVAFVWVLPLAFTLPLLIISNWTSYEGKIGYACGLQYHNTGIVYTAIIGLIVIASPLIIMFVTNVKVFLTARQQQSRVNSERVRTEERSVWATTVGCQGGGPTQYSDLGNNPADDQSSLSCFRRVLSRASHLGTSEQNTAQPAAIFSYGSTNCRRSNPDVETYTEKERDGYTHKGGATANKSSTELRDVSGYTGFSVTDVPSKKTCLNQRTRTASRALKDGVLVSCRYQSQADDGLCASCTSAIDKAEKRGTEVDQRYTNFQDSPRSGNVDEAEISAVLPTPSEKGENPRGSSSSSLGKLAENSSTGDNDSSAPIELGGKSKSSFFNFFDKGKEGNSVSRMGREPRFSWNIVSSTLLLVLAFFITYVPFLITRLIITDESFKLSEEIVTYTAMLTTLGNIVNPCIVLGARHKLRTDFIDIVCCKRR